MLVRPLSFFAVIAVILGLGFQSARGANIRITLPKRSELTPVQRLNREGVDAVRKHQYGKAEAIFYKAYLYDPGDPFTLNNLGYVSELRGKLDRAMKFYDLAAKQGGNADIDLSNAKQLEGKPMRYAWEGLKDVPMQIDHMNVEAVELLSQSRNSEAERLLQKALKLDPQNAFTLNNLGVADEAVGDYDDALKNYRAAAASHSTQSVVVTLDPSWRGKPVSKMAAESAKRLEKRMSDLDTAEAHASILSLRGVSALNQNDWNAAKQYFLRAYSLDPNNAFALNNRGYVAEKEGDLESAQFFYSKARNAGDAKARIGLATDRSVEGKPLATVASQSDQQVGGQIQQKSRMRRREPGPIELRRRDNTPVVIDSSASPKEPSSTGAPASASPLPGSHPQ